MTQHSLRLLEVIENDIVPVTRSGVASGNKIFGAAILRRSDLSVVVAAGPTSCPSCGRERLTQWRNLVFCTPSCRPNIRPEREPAISHWREPGCRGAMTASVLLETVLTQQRSPVRIGWPDPQNLYVGNPGGSAPALHIASRPTRAL